MLLAHYLHVVDPNYDMAPEAQRERDLLPLFDMVVVTSQYVRRRLRREGIADDRILVLRPGVEKRFRTGRTRAHRDPPTILTVSSQLPVKGLLAGVEVMETLRDRDWHWWIVGADRLDRAYAEKLRQRAASSAVANRIELVGPVDSEDIITWYDRADIFFLPSRFETCSMVTMEAMCRGRPVVAFRVGGLRELVNDGVTGYLAEAGAVPTAAGYLAALLEDPERRHRMGQAARTASEQFPDWSDVSNRLREFLRTSGRR